MILNYKQLEEMYPGPEKPRLSKDVPFIGISERGTENALLLHSDLGYISVDEKWNKISKHNILIKSRLDLGEKGVLFETKEMKWWQKIMPERILR